MMVLRKCYKYKQNIDEVSTKYGKDFYINTHTHTYISSIILWNTLKWNGRIEVNRNGPNAVTIANQIILTSIKQKYKSTT